MAGRIELAADPVQHFARPGRIILESWQLRAQFLKMREVLEKARGDHARQLLELRAGRPERLSWIDDR